MLSPPAWVSQLGEASPELSGPIEFYFDAETFPAFAPARPSVDIAGRKGPCSFTKVRPSTPFNPRDQSDTIIALSQRLSRPSRIPHEHPDTMQQEATHEAPPPAPSAPKGAHEVFLAIAGIAIVVMTACLAAYHAFGAQLTAGLDEACAEASFDAGQKLEASGNLNQAVQKYRQAMHGQFAREELRIQCGLAIGDLLFRQERYGEALEAYAVLPEQAFNNAGAFTGYVTALWRAGKPEQATQLGAVWLGLAEKEQKQDQQIWARNVLMQAANARGDWEEALRQGTAILALDPENDARVTVARVLRGQGKLEEARTHAETLVKNTQSPALQRAGRQLLDQLAADVARQGGTS